MVEEAWTAADRVQGGGVVATPLVPSSWAGEQVKAVGDHFIKGSSCAQGAATMLRPVRWSLLMPGWHWAHASEAGEPADDGLLQDSWRCEQGVLPSDVGLMTFC